MTFIERPHFDWPSRDRPDDGLDGRLWAFFRSEMPARWPACPEPPLSTVPLPVSAGRSRWTSARSRFALAASIGVLVAGLWGLGGGFSGVLESAAPSDEGTLPTIGRREKFDSPKPRDPNNVPRKESLRQDKDGTEFRLDFYDKW